MDNITFDQAIDILEITDISKLTVADIPKIEKKAKKRWHPDNVIHLNNAEETAKYTVNFQNIEKACESIHQFLDGTYTAGDRIKDKKAQTYQEPEEVIRQNASNMQATLKDLWKLVKENRYKLKIQEVILSDGFKLRDLLTEDFKEDIAMLAVISFFYGIVFLGILTGIATAINPVFGAIAGIVFFVQALSCIIGFLPLSRFWLPAQLSDVVIKFINLGLGLYNWAESQVQNSDKPWVVLLVRLPVLFAKLIKYVILFPLYEITKAIVGDKVVGVVKQNVNYYAGAADWYVEQLINQNPGDMTTDQLFDLSYIYSEFLDIKKENFTNNAQKEKERAEAQNQDEARAREVKAAKEEQAKREAEAAAKGAQKQEEEKKKTETETQITPKPLFQESIPNVEKVKENIPATDLRNKKTITIPPELIGLIKEYSSKGSINPAEQKVLESEAKNFEIDWGIIQSSIDEELNRISAKHKKGKKKKLISNIVFIFTLLLLITGSGYYYYAKTQLNKDYFWIVWNYFEGKAKENDGTQIIANQSQEIPNNIIKEEIVNAPEAFVQPVTNIKLKGSVGKLVAIFDLNFTQDRVIKQIEGTYYYPDRGGINYTLKGVEQANGFIEMEEFTNGVKSATCKLFKENNCYNGKMYNTDGKVFSMIMCTESVNNEVGDNGKESGVKVHTTLTIQGENVRLRQSASTYAAIVKELNTGDICTILKKGNTETINNITDYWYEVNHNDYHGWVFGHFTSLKENSN